MTTGQGNQGSPTAGVPAKSQISWGGGPLPQRNVWAAQKTTHSARGTRAYARRLGSFQSSVVRTGVGGWPGVSG